MIEEFNSSKIIAEMAKSRSRSGSSRCTRRQRTAAFENGGKVDAAEELMARMNAKYGTTGASQAAPASQPASQPQPQRQPMPVQQPQSTLGGIAGILKGRQQQIDKASGYVNGGLIEGIGSPTSDSIPAKVRETGEEIAVSTKERIVSHEQDKLLQRLAKAMGFESVDAFFEAGTGKPVGPTIKGGKKAAATGLSPELDPFAYRGGKGFGSAGPVNGPDSTGLDQGIAQQPSLATVPRQNTTGAATTPLISGIAAGPLGVAGQKVGIAQLAGNANPLVREPAQGIASGIVSQAQQKTGRDASGIITADSAKAAMAEPMQRSGGIFGTIDMKGVNDIMARENKARGEMIDSMIAANGGNGVGILPEVAAKSIGGDPLSDGLDMIRRGVGNRTQAGLAQKLIDAGVAMRGQDKREELARDGLIGIRPRQTNPLIDELTKEKIQGTQLRNERTGRLNDLQQQLLDETDPEKRSGIGEQIRLIGGKTQARPADQLTMPQRRTNAEITTARQAVSGLTPDEIKRKTANFTETGRENPEYDPTLAKALSQANRRMYGEADDWFDNRQQPKQPAGSEGDTTTRFRADKDMAGHKLGKQTDLGTEVFDSTGRLIGHYR